MFKFVEKCFLICRRSLFSCLNLYLKKESVLVPSITILPNKRKDIGIKLQNTFFELLNICII